MDAKIQLVEIRVIKFEISDYYTKLNKHILTDNFEFQFTQELRITENEMTIGGHFTVNLYEKLNEHTKNEIAVMEMANVIKIANWEDVIKKDNAELLIPDPLIHLINSLTVQHARGAFAAKIQDTIYGNAIIPLINPMILAPKGMQKVTLDEIQQSKATDL